MVFSPASVASALRMALYGARGRTATELARALHLAARTGSVAASGRRRVRPGGAGDVTADGSVTFRAPNTVWVQSGLPLRPEFTARLRGRGHGRRRRLRRRARGGPDADQPRDRRADRGKITGLLPPGAVSRATRLVLASAMYLKAGGPTPFPERRDRGRAVLPGRPGPPGPDRPDDACTAHAPTCGATDTRPCCSPTGTPPGHGRRAARRAAGRAATKALAAGGLRGLLAGTARHQVTLALPRFRLEDRARPHPGAAAAGRDAGLRRRRGLQRHHRRRPLRSARSRTRPTSTSTSRAPRPPRPPGSAYGRWPRSARRRRSP